MAAPSSNFIPTITLQGFDHVCTFHVYKYTLVAKECNKKAKVSLSNSRVRSRACLPAASAQAAVAPCLAPFLDNRQSQFLEVPFEAALNLAPWIPPPVHAFLLQNVGIQPGTGRSHCFFGDRLVRKPVIGPASSCRRHQHRGQQACQELPHVGPSRPRRYVSLNRNRAAINAQSVQSAGGLVNSCSFVGRCEHRLHVELFEDNEVGHRAACPHRQG